MGQVEDAEHAEDKRQAHRDDEQPCAVDQPVNQYDENEVHLVRPEDDRHPEECRSVRISFRRSEVQAQLHFAPGKPALIQSTALMPFGGFTHSAS